jgi:hypothetical protein
MAPYDGFTKPSTIKLNTLLIWIQILDLPVAYKDIIKTLAIKVGEFEVAEPHSEDYAGNFYRAWVRIDMSKQLKPVVSIIHSSKRKKILVKYTSKYYESMLYSPQIFFKTQKSKPQIENPGCNFNLKFKPIN